MVAKPLIALVTAMSHAQERGTNCSGIATVEIRWIHWCQAGPTFENLVHIVFACTSLTARSLAVWKECGWMKSDTARNAIRKCCVNSCRCQRSLESISAGIDRLESSVVHVQCPRQFSSPVGTRLVGSSCRGSHRRRSVPCPPAASTSSTEHLTILCYLCYHDAISGALEDSASRRHRGSREVEALARRGLETSHEPDTSGRFVSLRLRNAARRTSSP